MSLGLQSAAQIIDKLTGKVSATWLGWFQKIDNALIITGTLTDGHIIISDGGNNVSDGGAAPTGTVTHTGSLTDHAVIVGNGLADISALASLGTTTTVLHGNAAADPAFSAVVEADITLANNTTNNVSIARHGFTPILPNDATKYLDGTGAYTVPAGSGSVSTTGSPASGNLTKFSGATSITNGDLSGDVSTSSTLVTAIGANKVTDAMLRQGVATSVIGRSANSTGNDADIQSTVENHVLVRRSSVLGFTLEQSIGYWSPLTNGDPVTPEIVFDSFGDTIAVWTAL